MRIIATHHCVHALHAVDALLAHGFAAANVRAAKAGARYKEEFYAQKYECKCNNSQGKQRYFQHIFLTLRRQRYE